MTMTITSTAFAHQGSIPAAYTCDGRNVSPPLVWSGVPAGTKGLVLIVDDPDAPDPKAPKMTWGGQLQPRRRNARSVCPSNCSTG